MYDFLSGGFDNQTISLLRYRMVKVFTRMLGNRDDAMEVAQEAFLRCWKRQKPLGSPSELNSWIFRIGLNAAKDYRKSAWRRRTRGFPVKEPQADYQAVTEILIGQEEKWLLCQALDRLRDEEKDVFLLRQDGGLTFEEIATTVTRPVGTVKTQFRAAVSKLKLSLASQAEKMEETVSHAV